MVLWEKLEEVRLVQPGGEKHGGMAVPTSHRGFWEKTSETLLRSAQWKSNVHHVQQGKLRLDVRKSFVTIIVVKAGKGSPRGAMKCPSLDTFQSWWNWVLWSAFQVSLALSSSWPPEVPAWLRTLRICPLKVDIPPLYFLLITKHWICSTETLV